jgi:hypothetical protein
MSSCGCGVSSGSNNKNNKANASWDLENPDKDLYWSGGSHAAGATLGLRVIRSKVALNLKGIRSPNILIFAENPCLKVGSSIILTDLDAAACLDGLVECLSVTIAPVIVGTTYEVATNGVWTGAAIDFTSVANASLCDSTSTSKAPKALVCGATPAIADYKGFLSLRPLQSPPIAGVLKVFNGSDSVIWASDKDSPRPPVQGDQVELVDTAIKGTNSAKVLSVANAGRSTIIKLDRVVTGSVRTDNCSTFISRAAKIADLTFSVICGCQLVATLPASVSSDANFPAGRMMDNDGCAKQSYCVEIISSAPGNRYVLGGQIIL